MVMPWTLSRPPTIQGFNATMARTDRRTKDAQLQSTVAVVLIIITGAVLVTGYFVLGIGR